ncbi:hypothetical protein HDV57DRAFT_21634 [Trichoderma longibrachiatum]|uniref:Uncharacterized protein n=1 Tax=Trichoderma longibrachiatum ATCC 18648 TaxID=983965 RepID=A0A2T4CIN3_TRILO|nr:hypothetical protein M440DRAFT_84110 [Trichoderma longibrachiatum ATCC 18648]
MDSLVVALFPPGWLLPFAWFCVCHRLQLQQVHPSTGRGGGSQKPENDAISSPCPRASCWLGHGVQERSWKGQHTHGGREKNAALLRVPARALISGDEEYGQTCRVSVRDAVKLHLHLADSPEMKGQKKQLPKQYYLSRRRLYNVSRRANRCHFRPTKIWGGLHMELGGVLVSEDHDLACRTKFVMYYRAQMLRWID